MRVGPVAQMVAADKHALRAASDAVKEGTKSPPAAVAAPAAPKQAARRERAYVQSVHCGLFRVMTCDVTSIVTTPNLKQPTPTFFWKRQSCLTMMHEPNKRPYILHRLCVAVRTRPARPRATRATRATPAPHMPRATLVAAPAPRLARLHTPTHEPQRCIAAASGASARLSARAP